MDNAKYHYVGYYGYSFHRAVAEQDKVCPHKSGRKQLGRTGRLWGWVKRRITLLTFVLLLISGVLGIMVSFDLFHISEKEFYSLKVKS